MKTIFIINPKAGQKKDIDKIIEEIRAVSKEINATVDTYITECPGDGERYVREYCMSGEKARFIACGGDGTLSEVVTGSIDRKDCLIAVLPIGTGNDFCRNFCQNEIEEIFDGHTVDCDAIKCTLINRDTKKVLYCANMINIGFDCNVATLVARLKRIPLITGSAAYIMSILINFFEKKTTGLRQVLLQRMAPGCLLYSILPRLT